jgi:predicted acylesterase/phospholipase RssA
VSGGSVLAAYLVRHWDDFVGTDVQFEARSQKLLDFIKSDARGRILRFSIIRWLFPLLLFSRAWSRSSLLRSEYRNLFDNDDLGALRADPKLHILATGMGLGSLVSFSTRGITISREGEPDTLTHAGSLEIALAVAASSAFPPFFPPLSIENTDLGFTQNEDPAVREALTDGGVYDNLGVQKLETLQKTHGRQDVVFVSDASAPFTSKTSNRFKWVVDRTVRTTDILMKRVGDLEQKSAYVTARLGHPKPVSPSALPPKLQTQAARIRTDLDAFSEHEIYALMICGYERARLEWTSRFTSGTFEAKNNLSVPQKWTAAIGIPAVAAPQISLENSNRRRLLRWTWDKPGVTGAALAFVYLVAILLGCWHFLSEAFSDNDAQASESFVSYQGMLDKDGKVRGSFGEDLTSLELNRQGRMLAVASDLYYSWIVAPNYVYLFRSFTLRGCRSPIQFPKPMPSGPSSVEELVFIAKGGEGFKPWPAEEPLDCKDSQTKVLIATLYYEKILKGNYLLMYLTRFDRVNQFSFDVAISKTEISYPGPHAHLIKRRSLKDNRLTNLRFYELDLISLPELTPAAINVLDQFTNAFEGNRDFLAKKLRYDEVQLGLPSSPEKAYKEAAQLKSSFRDFQSFRAKEEHDESNIVFRYYRREQ